MSTAQFAGMGPDQALAFMAGAPVQPVRTRLAGLVAGRRVIDIGCGKGEEVGLYGPDQYLGVDCSPELIALARDRWPGYRFETVAAQELPAFMHGDRFPCGIMKAVLEHVPPDEAVAIYERARSVCEVLYVAWHWEPAEEKVTTYRGELGTMLQVRHDRARFLGMESREVVGAHVIWTVR